nr:phospholipid phosphatase 1-like isoform X2 [Onthophagus taurus]
MFKIASGVQKVFEYLFCKDNKIMTSSVTSIGPIEESTRLATADCRQTYNVKRNLLKPTVAVFTNTLVIIIVGLLLAFIEFDVIPTNKFGYYCGDPALSYQFEGDTITALVLILGSFLGPLIVIIAIEYRHTRKAESIRLIWLWYKDMLIGVVTTLMVTEVMKAIVGAPRPHFLSTCKPQTKEECVNGTFVRDFECQGTGYSSYVVGDSSRSFPSGHTSISVFASIFCVALVHYRLKWRRSGQLLKPFLMLAFLSWAAVCGLTRITDRRHHWWDVLAGTILGAIGAGYTIIGLVKRFKVPEKKNPPKSIHSRSTLLDEKQDRNVTCVI